MNNQFMPALVRNEQLELGDYIQRLQELEKCFLTIKEVCLMTGFHKTSVQRAIDTGRLIACKKDASHGARGGVWIIERKSVFEEWGDVLHKRGYNE